MSRGGRCPRSPSKVRYRTEARAITALVYLIQAGRGQKRVYRCNACAGWHTTAQEVRRRTGEPTPLPGGFIALLTWPGHEPGVRYDPFAEWRRTRRPSHKRETDK